MASHYHYLISKSPSPKMAKAPSSFKKKPRNKYPYPINQLYPRNQRSTSFAMSGYDMIDMIDAPHKRQPQSTKTCFYDILRLNAYPENSIDQTKHPQSHQSDSRPPNAWSYLKIPYISERLNHKITNIFRKEGIPVRVAHKSYALRRALSHNTTERTCTRKNCPTSSTKLCLLRNTVYQITCNNCNQHYIESTTRFIHDRVREHLNSEHSSVKKYISTCQNKDYKGIEIKTIVLENDPVNLRLFEEFYIRKYKPTLNSREECSEFTDILF